MPTYKPPAVRLEAVRARLHARARAAGSVSALSRELGFTRAHVAHAMPEGSPIPAGIVRALGYDIETVYRPLAPDGGQR